jgi:acyl carrier protein
MKNIDDILSEVFRLEREQLHDQLTMDDIERWDSLTHMDLITSIEEELEIQLTMDDIMNMKNIKNIRAIVSKK